MGGPIRWKVAAALGLPALALVIAALVLLFRGNSVAPIIITPPAIETSEETGQIGNAPAAATSEIRVHVSGAVAFPNVYSMRPGDRVIDAIAAAGGPTVYADLTATNLAQRVRDEGHYHIPALGEEPPAAPPATGGSTASRLPAPDGPIDLNRASATQLESLPGIGPVLAGAIVEYREGNGLFATVDDIVNVSGIGLKTLANIRGLVTVSGTP